MELIYKEGTLIIKSDKKSETDALLDFVKNYSNEEQPKKRKKQLTQTCPQCQQECKGLIGLGIHMRIKHGVPSKKIQAKELKEAQY